MTIFSADSIAINNIAIVSESSHKKLYAFALKNGNNPYLVSTTLDTPSQTWSLTPISYRPTEVKVYNDIIYFADGVDSKLKKIDDGVLETIVDTIVDTQYGGLFDVNQYGLVYVSQQNIFYSPDFGVNTINVAPTFIPHIFPVIKRIGDTTILAGTYDSRVAHTTDNGANWTIRYEHVGAPNLITNTSLIFSGGILLTSDLGQNWIALDTILSLHDFYHLEESDHIFAYGENGAIYKAANAKSLGTDNDGVHTPGERIRLFPNPAGETLQIEGHGAIRSLNVLDIRGRQVEAEYRKDSGTINTSPLPAGIYFLRVVLKNSRMESFRFEVM